MFSCNKGRIVFPNICVCPQCWVLGQGKEKWSSTWRMRAKIRTPRFQSDFIADVWMKCSLEFLTAFNLTSSEYKVVGKGYTGDHGENLNGGVLSFTFMACVWEILHSFPENNKPPKADAGPDKELTLPVDSTTLDGSKSSDDQKIVYFLWEKTRCVSPSMFLSTQIFHFKQVTPPTPPLCSVMVTLGLTSCASDLNKTRIYVWLERGGVFFEHEK